MKKYPMIAALLVIPAILLIKNFIPTKVDPDKCKTGNGAACRNKGIQEIKANNIIGASKSFEEGCRLNDSISCVNASYYLFELNTELNINKAIEYATKGCELKDETACVNLAHYLCFINRPDLAMVSIKKGLGYGYINKEHLKKQELFQCINETAEFKKMILEL